MLLWSALVVSAHEPGFGSEAKLIDRHTGPIGGWVAGCAWAFVRGRGDRRSVGHPV